MKLLVYTAVIGNYDWVFPPLAIEDDLTYIIVTDNPDLQVNGWQTVVVDAGRFSSNQEANRYYKMLLHRKFPEYDCSLYIDGNIRLLGKISLIFKKFWQTNSCLSLFHHPLRSSVQEEVDACLESGKINATGSLLAEISYFRQDGFPDGTGMLEAGIMLKNHRHPDLDHAMELWWDLFQRFGTRDQISLPYVLWKTGAPCTYHSYSFRDPNPFFGIYAHRKDQRAPRLYAYVQGRAYDSFFYSTLLRIWHLSWDIRRAFRKLKSLGKG